ncbi:MAG: RsiV family protein [Spirochaetaceae bacterium]|jgi:hypothetical protein|nr:RsiV family protein [Spirochaetaceae bacterium]
MKYIFTLFIFLSFLSLFSCVKQTIPPSNQQVEREAAAPVFQTLEFKETIVSEQEPVQLKEGERPQVEIVLSLLSVDGSQELRSILYQTLYKGKEPADYKNNVIEGWKAEYQGLWKEDYAAQETSLAALSGEYYETITLPFQHQSVLVIKQEIYEYKGGAHGNTEVQYFVIDLEKNSRVKLEDILSADSRPQLKQYLEKALRDYAAANSNEPLAADENIADIYLYWEDWWNGHAGLPENFFLSAEGLGIYWNQYEIASYAVGGIALTLPYSTIEPLLSADGRALITKLKK